jgi:hypothetical protein
MTTNFEKHPFPTRILIRDIIKNGIAAYIGINKKRLSAAKADEAFIIRRERGRYGYA